MTHRRQALSGAAAMALIAAAQTGTAALAETP